MNNKTIIEFGFRRMWRILQILAGVIHLAEFFISYSASFNIIAKYFSVNNLKIMPLFIYLFIYFILGMTCTGFPGPGSMSSLLANPMEEFIEPNGPERVHEMFEHFLLKFPKRYANTVDRKEHNQRRDIFRQNLR